MEHLCRREEDFKELYATRDLVILINERQQKHDGLLQEILAQVKHTNGRLIKVENWKKIVTGVAVALTAFVGVQWTVFTYLIDKFIK